MLNMRTLQPMYLFIYLFIYLFSNFHLVKISLKKALNEWLMYGPEVPARSAPYIYTYTKTYVNKD